MRVKYTLIIEEEQDPEVWDCKEAELCARLKQSYETGESALDELICFAEKVEIRVEPA